ncbi:MULTISPECIES: LacI family DNA-binding transcriptional regulator [unclassified Amycolatopsis]|uniref:LacI family DNA-binding transcriptional regulator n=1 Tax=unclassified Amycolatopsis TaxID=2618356 RepID=UPI002E2255A9|nr:MULTISPECIES: LacI family DNA-binding transcriptional regulator [unclassified Amycolatopsis]
MKRLTISDIADAAGVSTGAVSYALNGKPGVSAATRERVLEIADRMGWRPSTAARALTRSRSGAIGLIVDRPAQVLGIEPFFMQLVSGIEMALRSDPSTALMLAVTDDRDAEIETYRRWWAERRVDGVIVVDLHENDIRTGVLAEIGLPAVALGYPESAEVPCVWADDAAPMEEAVGYLAALGHRRIARVAGPDRFAHTLRRDEAFTKAAGTHRLEWSKTVHGDYSGDSGARAARRLLSERDRATAVIFDNDVMALSAMAAAQEMGVSVPEQLSIVSWDDSALCQLVRPAVTALDRHITQHGVLAIETLNEILAVGAAGHVQAPAPILMPRASTGRAPSDR